MSIHNVWVFIEDLLHIFCFARQETHFIELLLPRIDFLRTFFFSSGTVKWLI